MACGWLAGGLRVCNGGVSEGFRRGFLGEGYEEGCKGVESRISLIVVTCGFLADLCALTDQCWYHFPG